MAHRCRIGTVRIVVAGWNGTYWVKHITGITAVTKPFDGFWMKTAYRIPGWELSARRAFYFPGDGHEHAGYRDGRELAHYKPKRWHTRQGG